MLEYRWLPIGSGINGKRIQLKIGTGTGRQGKLIDCTHIGVMDS